MYSQPCEITFSKSTISIILSEGASQEPATQRDPRPREVNMSAEAGTCSGDHNYSSLQRSVMRTQNENAETDINTRGEHDINIASEANILEEELSNINPEQSTPGMRLNTSLSGGENDRKKNNGSLGDITSTSADNPAGLGTSLTHSNLLSQNMANLVEGRSNFRRGGENRSNLLDILSNFTLLDILSKSEGEEAGLMLEILKYS